jgi:hypothetical protein
MRVPQDGLHVLQRQRVVTEHRARHLLVHRLPPKPVAAGQGSVGSTIKTLGPRPGSTSSLTTHGMLVQQSLDTAQAHSELLGYLPSCDARPVEIIYDLKILGRETITQTPRGGIHLRRGDLHTRHCLTITTTL